MLKRYFFLFLNALIIFLVFLSYFHLVYRPSERMLQNKVVEDFRNKMTLKAALIDNTISRFIEGARSLSSRSAIRNKMVEYKRGDISMEELIRFSKPKYVDGVKALDNCVYAARYIDNTLIFSFSNNDTLEVNLNLPGSIPGDILAEAIKKGDILHVQVISPIKADTVVLGYDLIYSQCAQVFENFEDKGKNISIVDADDFPGISAETTKSIAKHDTIVIQNDSIICYVPSAFTNAYYSFTKERSQVFLELVKFRNRQIAIMALIILSFSLLLFIINRRSQLTFLRHSQMLEKLVDEKTLHLNEAIEELEKTNLTLKEREKELSALNQTKDKFFSIIAHDLINPLHSLMGLTELMRMNINSYKPAKTVEMLGHIEKGLEGTLKLLDNLLTWSRLQRGKLEFKPEETNLKSLVLETIEFLKPQALNKNQEIVVNIPDEMLCSLDADMITTVVRNLVSNAIKYSHPKGVIEVGASRVISEKHGSRVEVFIKDEGVGMPEEISSKLFTQVKTTSMKGTADEKGTGLGLVLCKEFVELHRGRIWVESKEGEGSVFRFEVPS